MTAAGRLAPATSDPDTGGFFAAAARGEVTLRYCAGCGALLHLPRAYCWHCGGWDTGYRAVAPRARVYSWTVVEHQVHPAYPVPYTVALVELADEPAARLVTFLPGLRPCIPARSSGPASSGWRTARCWSSGGQPTREMRQDDPTRR